MGWKEQVLKVERQFRYKSDSDWLRAEAIKLHLAESRAASRGLPIQLFMQIADWKLGRQRARTERYRDVLTAEMVRSITAVAFRAQHADADVLARTQIRLLTGLPGVGTGLATAILALTFPNEHGIVDFRVWRVVFGKEREVFSAADYLRYRRVLIPFAAEAGWSPQKADFMIWKSGERVGTIRA